jgi:hypothetical protein
MFFIRRAGQYWTGKEWADNYHQAIVYGSAATAISHFPGKYKKDCVAVGLNAEQWAEFASINSQS